ncbi:hypothetical protein B5F09_08055 [Erysipelatoclostridium sp. An173]|uniref:hypothetical protein n=1 Tax=unclassified Thomasclavelia TaxID=3025756 RepID=UPI000B3AC264|nr:MULTISPECIES: hypothetical protein [unclassified Thomasclavelia]OUP76787.1 hypothetical protein B5F09_08055 [Erysipelatoclostridium sp. An173]
MKKIIFTIIIVFVIIIMYFNVSYSNEKMQQLFNEYLIENIDDYEDYEMTSFGLYNGPTNGRGYAAFNKYFEAEYIHKTHSSIRFYLTTDRYNIISNYDDAKNELQYILYAIEIYNENINNGKIAVRTMTFPSYRQYSEQPATKNFVQSNMDLFYPTIEVNTKKVSYEELKEIDQEISHIFSNERYYILTDIDENIGIYSKQLEMYHNYEERYLED